jgi:hypothetical protein
MLVSNEWVTDFWNMIESAEENVVGRNEKRQKQFDFEIKTMRSAGALLCEQVE